MRYGRDGTLTAKPLEETPADLIARDLMPGETLIWADKPAAPRRYAWAAWPVAAFGFPFFSFAAFWTYLASSSLRNGNTDGVDGVFSVVFPMFGIPFLLVGAGLMLTPFYAWWLATRTIFGLTDKRLIIGKRAHGGSIRSWTYDRVTSIRRDGGASDTDIGDVFFVEATKGPADDRSVEKIGFIGITNPKAVAQEIQKRLDRLKSPSPLQSR
ncbi:MAG: hypothetical protein AAFP99_00595 [Pseudomonadota bacterium]